MTNNERPLPICPFCDSPTAIVQPLESFPSYVRCNECGGQGPRSQRNRLLILNVWCMLFHRGHIWQKSASGDWKIMECTKCNDTWTEPRL